MRDFDISKSKEMFLNYLKWCADYGVDTILKVNSGWTLTLSNEHIISLVLRRWIWLKYEAVFGVYLYVRYSCLMDSERSLEYSDNNACYKQVLFKTAGKRLPLYIFGSHVPSSGFAVFEFPALVLQVMLRWLRCLELFIVVLCSSSYLHWTLCRNLSLRSMRRSKNSILMDIMESINLVDRYTLKGLGW